MHESALTSVHRSADDLSFCLSLMLANAIFFPRSWSRDVTRPATAWLVIAYATLPYRESNLECALAFPVVPAKAGTHTPQPKRCGTADEKLKVWWLWVPAFALGHAHIDANAVWLGQSGATAFPPPLWGRDRERGRTRTAFVSYLRLNKCSQPVRACAVSDPTQCFVATPLPVPPPQGGREPCGAHLRDSRNLPAKRSRDVCMH
jgi:hypothetical protein